MRAFCTVVTRSHVPYVRALAESLRASGNPETYFVLVADAEPQELPPSPPDGLEFLPLADLLDSGPALMRHYYSAFEFTNALKPFLVHHLLSSRCTELIYLDSDLLITSSFTPVWTELAATSLLLTPHQFNPPPASVTYTNEIEIVDQGVLNGGFAAWRHTPAAFVILDWMRQRFPVHGFCDRAAGMFVDQKLLPLVAIYFPDDVRISRNPRLNVAFWNVHERGVVSPIPGQWLIDDQPVVFFHLSGYRLSRPAAPCDYLPDAANAAILATAPWLSAVLARYHAGLARHFTSFTAPMYRFARFESLELSPAMRRLLFNARQLDRRSPAYWRIRIIDLLKTIKRRIVRRRY